MKQIISTEEVPHSNLQALQGALTRTIANARMANNGVNFGGSSGILIEDEDGWNIKGVALERETLSDGSHVFNARLLFGDNPIVETAAEKAIRAIRRKKSVPTRTAETAGRDSIKTNGKEQELKSTVDFVREEMAGLMVAFAESVPSRNPERLWSQRSATQTEQAAPGEPALTQWLTTPISTLMNWYRGLEFRVNQLENAIPELVGDSSRAAGDSKLVQRIETLESLARTYVSRIETLERNAADMLFQLENHRHGATLDPFTRWIEESVPTAAAAPAETPSTKTDPNKERSANQMYQAALENRCGICGLDRSVHLGGSGHDWVPTPATEPPVQDSSKTDLEESK
jgi:hypothetical protein